MHNSILCYLNNPRQAHARVLKASSSVQSNCQKRTRTQPPFLKIFSLTLLSLELVLTLGLPSQSHWEPKCTACFWRAVFNILLKSLHSSVTQGMVKMWYLAFLSPAPYKGPSSNLITSWCLYWRVGPIKNRGSSPPLAVSISSLNSDPAQQMRMPTR